MIFRGAGGGGVKNLLLPRLIEPEIAHDGSGTSTSRILIGKKQDHNS